MTSSDTVMNKHNVDPTYVEFERFGMRAAAGLPHSDADDKGDE